MDAEAIPADFPHWSSREPLYTLRERYKRGDRTLHKWAKALGIVIVRNPIPPIPADFEESTKGMGMKQVASFYGVSWRTAGAWCKARKTDLHGSVVRAVFDRPAPLLATPIPPRDDSRAGDAADFLRRDRWTVYNLHRVKGHPNRKLWQVGSTRISEADMIAKAEAKGWVYSGDMMMEVACG